jgi:hypothetical protein
MTQATQAGSQLRLRRVLGVWDLIFYGMVVIQPTAPIPLFGVVQTAFRWPHGHDDSDCDVRHGDYSGELWAHGLGLPIRSFRLYICREDDQPTFWVSYRLGYAAPLFKERALCREGCSSRSLRMSPSRDLVS